MYRTARLAPRPYGRLRRRFSQTEQRRRLPTKKIVSQHVV
jgi:hypothetical protein